MGKKRKFYKGSNGAQNKRFKDGDSGKLTPGVAGVLITHDRGKERLCRIDAFKILNHFANLWYGPEFDDTKEDSSPSDGDENDIDAALSTELNQIKGSVSAKTENKRRFLALKSGCNNIIFIKTNCINPSEFVQRLVDTLVSTEQESANHFPLVRHLLRVHPAETSCKAHLLDIKNEVESYLPAALYKISEKCKDVDSFKKEFAVLYRGRNNDHLGMHVVTEAVCESAEVAVSDWKFNCRTDQVVLLIDVIQTVCLMSVVQNYAQRKKFNFRELCKPYTEKVVMQAQKHVAAPTDTVSDEDAKNFVAS